MIIWKYPFVFSIWYRKTSLLEATNYFEKLLAEEKNFEKLLAEKKNFEKLLAEKKTKNQHLEASRKSRA